MPSERASNPSCQAAATVIRAGGENLLAPPFEVRRRRDRNADVPAAEGLKVRLFVFTPRLNLVQEPDPVFRWTSKTKPVGAFAVDTATVNVSPTLPEEGLTFAGTLTTPDIP